MSITEEVDQTDIEILKMLQDDCRVTLDEMANKLKISKSTVYYRIKKLERLGIILGCHAKLSPEKMGKDYVAIVLVKAKYGAGYHEKVGQKLAEITGVTVVYYIFAEIVLKTGDVGKAVAYVKSIIDKLKAFQFDIDDVIIWKTLDKSLNEYKVLTPHVAAAKQLIEAGYKVGKGDMVGYVIVKGGGAKLAYKVKPYILIKDIREIDVDYYIEKQVIPAAMRILEVLGVKESQLMEGKAGKSILDFFQ